jgi:hypothetical protein
MFIYLIVNHETGKYYVGQHKGNNLQHYLQKKLSSARYHQSGQSYLFNSMRKYPQSSIWSIHALRSDIQTREELDETERDFIRFLKAQNPEYGYNICRGGEGFTGPHSEASKKKTSAASKRTWQDPEFRKRVIPKVRASLQTEEYKLKASLSHMGHETSDMTREKISKAHKDNWQDLEYRARMENFGVFKFTKEQLSKNGRKGGTTIAKHNMDNKLGIFGATHEQRVEWGKKAGPIGGRIGGAVTASKPGFLAEIGRIARCKHWQVGRGKPCICDHHSPAESFFYEKHPIICTKKTYNISKEASDRRRERMAALGKIQGKKNAESGHLDSIRTKESCSKGGKMTTSRRILLKTPLTNVY